MKRIAIKIENGKAVVSSLDFLGNDWGAYSGVCNSSGARWNKKRGVESANIAPIENLPALVRDLGECGFGIVLDEASKESLKGAAATGLSDAEAAAKAEIAEREFQMNKRGLSLWKPYQQDGAVFLLARDRALIGDEMGTGKTIQVLAALPDEAAVLVICPASVVINWARETRKWRPEMRVFVVLRSASLGTIDALQDEGIWVTDAVDWPDYGQMIIVNYESLHWAAGSMDANGLSTPEAATMEGKPTEGTILVGDEIHRVKNKKAKVTQKWGTLRDAVKTANGTIWGASGTPLYNRPFDIVGVLNGIGAFNDVFVSWKDFLGRCGGSEGQYGIEWSGIIDPTVAKSLQRVMIRREKKDVMKSLPPITYRDIEVEPSKGLIREADALMKRLKDEGYEEEFFVDHEDEIEADHNDYHHERLERLSSKIRFEDMSALHAEMSKVGLKGAMDLIEDYEEQGEPVVVFSPHRAQVETLGAREGWATILGGDDLMKRAQVVADFQAGKYKGVACTIKAGGVGITLTHSSNVIFLSLDWSPAENEQAAGRVHRGTQTRGVLVTRMVPDHPFVKRLMTLLGWKTTMAEDMIGAASLVDSLAEERQRAAQEALLASERDSMASAVLPAAKVDVRALLARIPAGRYATDGSDGTTSFWSIDKPEAPSKWAGWTFVKIVAGPNLGKFSTVRPDGMATAQCASVLEKIAVDPIEAGARYGRETGLCSRCSQNLTDSESVARGYGPVCWSKMQDLVGGAA